VLWAASGFFIVGPDEVGVIQRFGEYNRTVGEGPHIRLPYPIESHLKLNITQWQRLEIGFRAVAGGQTRLVPVEASMLTSDENVVMVQFIIQYRIGQKEDNAKKFLFNLTGQHETVRSAAEAAMREVIDKSKIDAELTEGKAEIQLTTKTLLQTILDEYDAGVEIGTLQMQDVHAPQEVMTAFCDVASARENKIHFINEAEKYHNEFIPEARGIAARILNEAEAYKENVVLRAQGESQRFLAIVAEYNKTKDVTKKRMYLEAMESILSAPGME
jgi:membrane protease subunit HflK